MRSMKWFLCVVLLLLVVSVEAAVVGEQYGMGDAHLIEVPEGDPIWMPTLEQVTGWVDAGISAAAAETPLHSVTGISQWEWSRVDGIATSDGVLHDGIVMTPQLVATTAGWWAAWDEETWARILENQPQVAADIGGQVHRRLTSRDLLVMFVLRRDSTQPVTPTGAVYYLDEWRALNMSNRGSVSDYASDQGPAAAPDRTWAARYVLAAAYSPTSSAGLGVIEGQLLRNPTRGPDPDLISQVQAPETGMRCVIGGPEEFAWLDF